MKKYLAMMVLVAFFTEASQAQKTDTLIKKLDSLQHTHKTVRPEKR